MINLTVDGLLQTQLDQLVGRAIDLSPVYRAVGLAWRADTVNEILLEQWRPPSGAPRPWPKRHPFGTRGLSPNAYGAAYLSAWRGGSGSILRVSKTGVEVGVELSLFPWVKYHRPGTGAVRAADVASGGYRVKPKTVAEGRGSLPSPQRWAMWWLLGMEYGVWLKRDTLERGLFVPYRPHAGVHPQIRTRAVALLSAHVAGRPLPTGA